MPAKKKLLFFMTFFLVILTLSVKAWVEPSDTESTFSMLNSSSTGQSKLGSLILNLGGAAVGLIVDKGFVGIGTTNPKAVLDVTSTNSVFIAPRMTTAQRDAIISPPEGLEIFNTTTKKKNVFNGIIWGEVGGDSTPVGTIAYFDLTTCPTGWSEFQNAKGRYLVGTQNSANKNLTVGQALSDGENRSVGQHNHSAWQDAHNHGAWQDAHQHATYYEYSATQTNNCGLMTTWGSFRYSTPHIGAWTGSDWRQPGVYTDGRQPGVYTSNAGSIAGTNAPYVEFLVCEKN